jgi:hypothetical protein
MAKDTKPTQPTAIRENWLTAPAAIRLPLEHLYNQAKAKGGRNTLTFVRQCFSHGYDCARDEIPTPITNELKAASNDAERIRIKQRVGSLEIGPEDMALKLWDAMATWRTSTLAAEHQTKRDAAAAEQRQQAIRIRAAEILEENQRDAERSALAQAEKEFTNV